MLVHSVGTASFAQPFTPALLLLAYVNTVLLICAGALPASRCDICHVKCINLTACNQRKHQRCVGVEIHQLMGPSNSLGATSRG
jgi:hypothetical protein